MDPFVQAAKRFVARSGMGWRVGKVPVLRAVAAADERGELVNVLRWEEAQPSCRRPLIVVEEPFEEAGSYFEAVTRAVLEGHERLRGAATEAGVTLPEVRAAESSEPVVRAVKTAEVAAAGMPITLEGLTIALAPERVRETSSWATQVAGLLEAATALSGSGSGSHEGRVPVRWVVHDVPGGALAESLGEGVAFGLDDGAVFAWVKQATEKASTKADATEAPERAAGAGALSAGGATALQRHVFAAAEALQAREPKRAVESFRAARSICAAEGRAEEEAGILLALAGAQLAASAPAEAVASYRVAHELAATKETWTLACQAKLGEAGAEMLQRRHGEAATAYVEAAELARQANLVALRVEALRMAGVCHLLGGDKQQAVRLWQTAVDAGLGLDRPAREPTSFAQVANDLVELLERLGMKVQAYEVRRRLAEESGAAPEEMLEPVVAPTASIQPPFNLGADVDATQAVRIFLPRKALPFVAGTVDLGWLDAMVRASEAQEAPQAAATFETQEIRVPANLSVLPFAAAEVPRAMRTAIIDVLAEIKAVPFVAGSVDPGLFQKPEEDTLDDTLDGGEEADAASTTQEIRAGVVPGATPFQK